MCRSIKKLRRPGQPATAEELNQAALQFVRKISGFQKPSQANREAFESAVMAVAEASGRLLRSISNPASSKPAVPESDTSPLVLKQ